MEGDRLSVHHGIREPGKELKTYRVRVQPAGFDKPFFFILTTAVSKADLEKSAHSALVRALEYGGAYEILPADTTTTLTKTVSEKIKKNEPLDNEEVDMLVEQIEATRARGWSKP
jgi:hypothetical protein